MADTFGADYFPLFPERLVVHAKLVPETEIDAHVIRELLTSNASFRSALFLVWS